MDFNVKLKMLRNLRSQLLDEIDEYVSKKVITPEEREVIYHRNFERKSLEEVGKQFGVIRERIRQIETKAFSKIKDSQHTLPRISVDTY